MFNFFISILKIIACAFVIECPPAILIKEMSSFNKGKGVAIKNTKDYEF